MDSRLIKARPLPEPLLLKDYLLDDMSSCSSNGFKSFPRRQCCGTTVRFIHEFDRKNKQQLKKNKKLNTNKTPPKSAMSAFQSVITAVKRLPFSAAKSPEKNRFGNSFLTRSFSKKLFKRSSFWKKKPEKKEIGRWKSFDELLKEDPVPSDRSYSSITATESKSDSWMASDFTTVSTDQSLGGSSSNDVKLNLPKERDDVVEEPNKVVSGKTVDVPNDDVSVDSTTSSDGSASTKSSTNTKSGQQKQWRSEEKEQFSPVSVLDCDPFDDDDDDEVSSDPFQHRLARMEGSKKKLMKKIHMFESLAKLEPVNLLATRFTSQADSDNESIDGKFVSDIEDQEQDEEEENYSEKKALELLQRVKATSPSYNLKLNADKLLLDFFRENINNECAIIQEKQCLELLKDIEEWINGVTPCGNIMEWEVKENRKTYVKGMEKRGLIWKTLGQENDEVALELENEVYSALLNELVLDII